jgi:hypothetical protein
MIYVLAEFNDIRVVYIVTSFWVVQRRIHRDITGKIWFGVIMSIAIINHTFLNNFIAVSFQIKKLQFLKYIFLFCFVFFLINQALFVKIFKLF